MSEISALRRRLEAHLDELPVLPSVVVQLMTLDRGDDDYADKVIALIGAEPNFSARVIATANSAASAPASPITTLGAAIARIGSVNASNLIMTLGVTRVFVPQDDWERGLWRHALQVALAARALVAHARPQGLDPNEVYLAGLLHDVGRFVLFQEAPDALRRIDESEWATGESLMLHERSICGLDHTELGALACRRWSIPATIAESVAQHHRPPEHPVGTAQRLTAIVHVADLAMFSSVTSSGAGATPDDAEQIAEALHSQLPRDVAMSAGALQRIILTVTEEAAIMCELIGIG